MFGDIDISAPLRDTITLLIELFDYPEWYDLYRKILDAGKSVQAYMICPDEIVPLLDAIGGRGVYVLALFSSDAEVERILKRVEQYY